MKRFLIKDEAQVSVNKGTNISIGSFARGRIMKYGINPLDIKRLSKPFETSFLFEPVDKPISITPIAQLGNKKVKTALQLLFSQGAICENQCYANALRISRALKQLEVKVDCAEGFYNVSGEWYRHRFNVIDGMYFDATAEYCLNTPVQDIKYVAKRIYTSNEMLVISAVYGLLIPDAVGFSLCCSSTLPYNTFYDSEFPDNDYYIDDNGFIHKTISNAA